VLRDLREDTLGEEEAHSTEGRERFLKMFAVALDGGDHSFTAAASGSEGRDLTCTYEGITYPIRGLEPLTEPESRQVWVRLVKQFLPRRRGPLLKKRPRSDKAIEEAAGGKLEAAPRAKLCVLQGGSKDMTDRGDGPNPPGAGAASKGSKNGPKKKARSGPASRSRREEPPPGEALVFL